jgi:type IV pilus assembly protein PilV
MKRKMNIKKQAGFNLIEVLLAFLILSIGLLGVAGLQTTAVKASHTAMLRTVAITKVQEIIARIRVNTAAPIISYAQVRAASDSLGEDKDCDGVGAVSCVAADLADNDLFTWGNSLVNAGLPLANTAASIVIDDTFVPPIATITVFWQERGEEMFYETTIQ